MKFAFLALSLATMLSAQVNITFQRPEQLVQDGAKLGRAAAQELETAVEKTPEDLAARAKLLGYYYYQWMQPGAEATKTARRRHILWLIELHPEAQLTGLPEAFLEQGDTSIADPDGYRMARQLWLKLLESNSANAMALGNLAKFFQYTDKDLAEKALFRARAAEPQNLQWDWQLGYLYAMGVMGVDGVGMNGQPTSVDPLIRTGPFAEKARKALAASTSGTMLSVAASLIWRYGTMLASTNKDKAEMVDHAIELIEQARKAEPGNPSWPQFLAQLQAYKRQSLSPPNPAK